MTSKGRGAVKARARSHVLEHELVLGTAFAPTFRGNFIPATYFRGNFIPSYVLVASTDEETVGVMRTLFVHISCSKTSAVHRSVKCRAVASR